jgi:hypothetical protein
MISFLEYTWFLWWIFAVIIVLRWFHTVRVDRDDDLISEVNAPAGQPPSVHYS